MVLGFMVGSYPNPIQSCLIHLIQAHGYATHEFEVTPERLGVYLPVRIPFIPFLQSPN